ncbi:MAG: transglycosylase SLT domain-containing protein [Bacteroidales bacterium]|nr:transglycosylase SLT domain-containing protein [Bacteroidales bacterium]
MSGKAVRFIVCLLALLLLEAGLSSHRQTTSERFISASRDYPSASLRFLSPANCGDKATLRRIRGQRYGQMQGVRRYEELIRRQAQRIGMDWRLLSAIIWHESQFNERACSPMAAKGLMQVRDVTAAHFGYSPDELDLFDPETNVAIGARLIDELVGQFRKEGMDSTNAVRFALASYNCGGGTLAKRRAEAAEAGFDPADWAAVALIFERYSRLTPAYVDSVEQTYYDYCSVIE